MKRPAGAALAAMMLCLSVPACFGALAQARGMSVLATSWPAIAADVQAGADVAGVDVTGDLIRAEQALATGDPARLEAVDWPRLRALARAGIGARELAGAIGPGVAASLMRRLEEWDALWHNVGGN